MTAHPEKTICLLFLFTVLVYSYVLRIFEITLLVKEDHENWESNLKCYFDAIYLVIVTITTVGYGDIYP